jgi:class 3 adenylate cyclase
MAANEQKKIDEKTALQLKPVLGEGKATDALLHNDSTVQLISEGNLNLLHQLAASRPASRIDTTPIDMDSLVENVARIISTTQDHYKCIMFTDLVGSTQYKREMGHTKGYMRNRIFCDICEEAVTRYDGAIVKRLGDGVMAVFEQAIDAVLAAMLIRRSIGTSRKKLKKIVGGIDFRIGITCGYVKELPGDRQDFIGHAMDKGSRIEGSARVNQVLIDEIVYGLIHTKIRDYSDDILIGKPRNITLKGIGVSTLYEIAPKDMGFAGSLGNRIKSIFS